MEIQLKGALWGEQGWGGLGWVGGSWMGSSTTSIVCIRCASRETDLRPVYWSQTTRPTYIHTYQY